MPTKLQPPIILIGNHRSGTTIVQKLFGLSPEIATWYEPRTLWRYADPARIHDEYDEYDATDDVVRYIRRRFWKYQSRNGDCRVMEKTPSNVFRVRYLHSIFPDATYLFVVRNPFSYISSMQIKWPKTKTWNGLKRTLQITPPSQLPYYAHDFMKHFITRKIFGQPAGHVFGPRYKGIQEDLQDYCRMTVIARQWALGNARAREDLAKLGNVGVLTFRYEDLVADPKATLRQLYEHCQLKCSAQLLETAQSMVDPGRQEKWMRLNPAELREVVPEIRAEMAHYGYEVPAELR